MPRQTAQLILAILLACAASQATAHEFWIEPRSPSPVAGPEIVIDVKIGEQLEGRAYPLRPGAYRHALWIGPDGMQDLTAPGAPDQVRTLARMGDGLHILAVESSARTHTYRSDKGFRRFAEEIGAEDVLRNTGPLAAADGRITEVYRRLSKTLVRFDGGAGPDARADRRADRRIGLRREWVRTATGFVLFDRNAPAPGRIADVHCRTSDGELWVRRLTTDKSGRVDPDRPARARCLINTVFLEPDPSARSEPGAWRSDWVSIFVPG